MNLIKSLSYKPSIVYFGIPMGILGLSISLKNLLAIYEINVFLAFPVLILGWISFLFISTHYFQQHLHIKLTNQSHLLESELKHPFKRSFLPSISLTAMLFMITILQVYQPVDSIKQVFSAVFWGVILAHLLINIYLLNGWIFKDDVAIQNIKPTWFIVISGNFVVVISLASFPSFFNQLWIAEVAVFFFATGLFLWLVFVTLIFYRLFFHEFISTELKPSLFIFLAPPSLASVAAIQLSPLYESTYGSASEFIMVVEWSAFSFATLMLLLWTIHIKGFRQVGINVSAWAYIYPLAAYTLALQFNAQALQQNWMLSASAILIVFTLLIMLLLLKKLGQQALQKC